MDLTKGDQFYDEGIDLDDEVFDTLEDHHIERIIQQGPPEPFNMPDYTNSVLRSHCQ